MTDITQGGAESAPPPEPFAPVDLDASDAREQLVEQESREGADAAPVEEQTSGETEATDSAEETLPPIEAPKSWTKDRKEQFGSLPRELQQYVADRAQEQDRDFRQRQNEAAEKLKGLTAKEQAVEQARQQYETTLPQLFQLFQQQQAGEFADIRTIQDVEKLAREDWPRYLQWDVAQKKMAAVQQEVQMVQQRQMQDRSQKFNEFAKSQDSLFSEKVADMADPEKAKELQKRAISVLTDLGFTDAELAKSWSGEGDISLRDHRMQLLIRDATLWREAQSKAKSATPKAQAKPQSSGSGAKGGDDLASVAEKGDMEAFFALRAKQGHR